MAIYKEDIVDINLETGNIHRSFLGRSIGTADSGADHFGVRVFRDGAAVSLSGVSVQGYFRDSHGNNIAITSGNSVSGNVAKVVLPQACYNYEGQFVLAIKLVGGGVTGTVRIVDGVVDNTNTGGAVAPTSTVPTYQEVLALYEQAIAVVNNSVRYNEAQSLTDTQKAQARANISATSEEETAHLKSAFRLNSRPVSFSSSDIDNTVYLNSTGGLANLGSSDGGTIIISCEENTSYLIEKMTSPVFRVAYTKSDTIAAGMTLYGYQNLGTATVGKIETGEGAKKLIITYFVNNTGYDKDAIFNSLSIVGGLSNTEIDIYQKLESNRDDIEAIANSYPLSSREDEPYNIEWEQGSIDPYTGETVASSSRIRTKKMPIGYGIHGVFNAATPTTEYWVRIYDSTNNYIGAGETTEGGSIVSGTNARSYQIYIDSAKELYPTAAYVALSMKYTSGTSVSIAPSDNGMSFTRRGATIKDDFKLEEYFATNAKQPYSSSEITFLYNIGNGYQTRGYIKLPSNYTPFGKKVPLVVFVHGSGDIPTINAASMTSSYQSYYNFIRDNGYAIFDCYGIGSKYSDGSYANTWGIPLNDDCYLSGIHYVCDKYNIDPNNIFVCCKSLGGLQAFNMLLSPAYNVKAVGMLAPELWELAMKFGYQAKERKLIAENLGFSEDTGHVLDFDQGDPTPSGFYAYVTENMDKWNGIFPNFRGLPILPANKPNYYRENREATGNMFRNSLSRPLKIWIAQDDEAVSYTVAQAVVNSLINSGSNAELRTMPNNTGGHHSVDNAANAPQTTNVTTKLGVVYASVPTAYYEYVQFIERFLSE